MYICKELTQIGFQNSTCILLLQAKAYETGAGKSIDDERTNELHAALSPTPELQLARTCCEDARTIDPHNLDSMDIFSNILFVLVSAMQWWIELDHDGCVLLFPGRLSRLGWTRTEMHRNRKVSLRNLYCRWYERCCDCVSVSLLPLGCMILGNFYSIRNDHARAIQYFTRALRMNPDYPAAWILLGHEFVEGKNHAAAINAYREALGKSESIHRC